MLVAIEEDTVRTRLYTGKLVRRLRNKLANAWEMAVISALPMPLQSIFVNDLIESLYARGQLYHVGGKRGTGQTCGI